MKLRGEWSFGIFAPLSILNMGNVNWQEGDEVSEVLDIVKYEPPEPKDESAKGGLPFGTPKTDENRYQNLKIADYYGVIADITEKIDGQSCSYGFKKETDYFFVAKRSMELKWKSTDEQGNVVKHVNNFTDHIERYGIEDKLRAYCQLHNVSLALRGESYGVGIQNMKANPHSKKKNGWAMFSVWNIDENRYERKGDKHYFLNVAKALDLPTVGVWEKDVKITPQLIQKYSEGLEKINGEYFEGVVVNTNETSFKIINLKYDSLK
jgi:RNA ligase (TIGR02306 family)